MFVKVGGEQSSSVRVDSGVPQGSVLGPLLFITYISPIEHLIRMFGVGQIAYADDVTLCINLKSSSISVLCQCLSAISDWFLFNDLMLNPDKSQCLKVGTRSQVKSFTDSSLNICNVIVPFADTLTLLGVTFDSVLSFDNHISNTCSAASYHLKALRHIRRCIDFDTAKIIASAFIASRLDYCNALLTGVSDHNINRLQRIQNIAAKIVCNNPGIRAVDCCQQLHWLPIKQRAEFKTSLMIFKALYFGQPEYLRSLINVSKPMRPLRSSANGLMLDIPFCKTETASRAFAVSAPKLWNSLPVDIRTLVEAKIDNVAIINQFKNILKTFLFKCAYGAEG
jgi:hypothetical protein